MTGSEFEAASSSPSATTLKQSQQQYTRNHQQRNNIFSTYQDQYDAAKQRQKMSSQGPQYCANNSYLNGGSQHSQHRAPFTNISNHNDSFGSAH